MSDAADLARRFLMVWEEYLTAVLSNPSEAGLVQPWIRAASALADGPRLHDGAAGEEARQSRPPAGAAAPAVAPDKRDQFMAELERRIADLEARVAGIERKRGANTQARRRNRGVRAR